MKGTTSNRRFVDLHQPTLHGFGDSFLGVIKPLKLDGRNRRVRTTVIGGAAAKSLSKSRSTLAAFARVQEGLKHVRPGDTALLVFGNVDLQMNYVFRLLSSPHLAGDHEGMLRFAQEVTDKYVGWIKDMMLPLCRDKGVAAVFVSGALLPVVLDDAYPDFVEKYVNHYEQSSQNGYNRRLPPPDPSAVKVGDAAVLKAKEQWNAALQQLRGDSGPGAPGPDPNSPAPTTCWAAARLLVEFPRSTVKLASRISLVQRFNALLADAIRGLDRPDLPPVHFIDVNPFLTDESGLVAPRYISYDPTNVHTLWEPTLPFWVEELERCGMGGELRQAMGKADLEGGLARYHEAKELKMESRRFASTQTRS